MTRNFVLNAVAGAALLASLGALAVEPKSAESLRANCEAFAQAPESDAAQLCILYVNGFLDGAIVTDQRVAENVADEAAAEESFSQRAIRTRIASRIREYGPSYYAEFCVGLPIPIADVIGHVNEEFARYDDLDGILARAIVDASLRRHYPCSPGD